MLLFLKSFLDLISIQCFEVQFFKNKFPNFYLFKDYRFAVELKSADWKVVLRIKKTYVIIHYIYSSVILAICMKLMSFRSEKLCVIPKFNDISIKLFRNLSIYFLTDEIPSIIAISQIHFKATEMQTKITSPACFTLEITFKNCKTVLSYSQIGFSWSESNKLYVPSYVYNTFFESYRRL